MRISYVILTLLIFISCSSTKSLTTEQIVGKYQWHGVYGIRSTIELKADQTFEYNWQTGLISGTTFGIWKRDENKITLNSKLQPPENEIQNFEIIRIEKYKSDSLSIKVIGYDNESLPSAFCVLMKDGLVLTGAGTDLQGETKLPKSEADSLIISFIGYKTISIPPDSSISKYIFKMEEGDEYYEYFTDETWTYKDGRLYDPSIKKDKYVKKNYYERIKK